MITIAIMTAAVVGFFGRPIWDEAVKWNRQRKRRAMSSRIAMFTDRALTADVFVGERR